LRIRFELLCAAAVRAENPKPPAVDLFDAEHDGFLTDANLLEILLTEKLQAEADKLKADGWS
jgi:hypothetical protein